MCVGVDSALWHLDVCAVGINLFAQTEHCLCVCVRAAFFPIR